MGHADPPDSLPESMSVLERGWLSSNTIVFRDDAGGGTVVDTGYVTHAEQTMQLVTHALGGRPLRRIVNTHLHSDHCGGNALLRARTGCEILIPPGHADAVAAWDESRLTYRDMGQRCDRFVFDAVIEPGASIRLGPWLWQAIAGPGHDPHQLMFWLAAERILISADVLWERGFGAIFPELEGEPGFGEQRAMLDRISELAPAVVIPGHGAPFSGVAAALARAYARLDVLQADPVRNARSIGRVMVKFHLLEVRETTLARLVGHFEPTRVCRILHTRYFPNLSAAAMIERFVDDLVDSRAARRDGYRVMDAGGAGR